MTQIKQHMILSIFFLTSLSFCAMVFASSFHTSVAVQDLELAATVINPQPVQFEQVFVWLSVQNKGDNPAYVPLVSCGIGTSQEKRNEINGTIDLQGNGVLHPGEIQYGVVSCFANSIGSKGLFLMITSVLTEYQFRDQIHRKFELGEIEIAKPQLKADLDLIESFNLESPKGADSANGKAFEHREVLITRSKKSRAAEFREFCSRRIYPQRSRSHGPLEQTLAEPPGARMEVNPVFRSTYYLNDRVGYLSQVADFINRIDCKDVNRNRMYPPYVPPDAFSRDFKRQRSILDSLRKAGDNARTAATVWAAKVFFWEILADGKPNPEALFRHLSLLGISLDEMTKQSIAERVGESNEDQPKSPECRRGGLS